MENKELSFVHDNVSLENKELSFLYLRLRYSISSHYKTICTWDVDGDTMFTLQNKSYKSLRWDSRQRGVAERMKSSNLTGQNHPFYVLVPIFNMQVKLQFTFDDMWYDWWQAQMLCAWLPFILFALTFCFWPLSLWIK